MIPACGDIESGDGREHAGERHLLVRAGEDLCLLPLAAVRRIVRDLQVFPLAGAAAELKGLAELGGEPMPVLDLARLIGAAPGLSPQYPVTIVAWAGGGGAEAGEEGTAESRELVGLTVDAALEVVRVPADAVVAGGEGIVRGEAPLGEGTARVISLAALGSRRSGRAGGAG